jgi:hypothetical protein
MSHVPVMCSSGEDAALTTNARARRRVLRWFAAAVLVLICLAVVIVAIAPMVAGSVASNAVLRGIGDQVTGRATLQRVRLSWFGTQRIENLSIVDAGGTELADVSVEAPVSLWSLVWGNRDFGTVTVSGVIHVERDAQGQLNWGGMLPSGGPVGAGSAPAGGSTSGGSPPAWPTVQLPKALRGTIDFSGLKTTYEDHRHDTRLELTFKSGQASVESGGPISLVAHGLIADSADLHPIEASLTITDALDAEGQLDLEKAQLAAGASWQLPAQVVDLFADESLASAIGRGGVVSGRLDASATTSAIKASLMADSESGRISLDADLRGDLRTPAGLAGDARLSGSFASALLTSLLPDYSAYFDEVAGPDVVFEADVKGGLAGGDARITVGSGRGLAMDGRVVMRDNRVSAADAPLRMQLRVTQSLLDTIGADGLQLVEGADNMIVLDVPEFELPLDDNARPNFDGARCAAVVTAPSLALTNDSPVGTVLIRDTIARIDSGNVAESIRLEFRGVAGPPDRVTGQLGIDARIAGAFSGGRPSLADAKVDGTAIIEAFPSVVLQPVLAAVRADAVRDLGDTITGRVHVLGNPMDTGGLDVRATLHGDRASVDAAVRLSDGKLMTGVEGVRVETAVDGEWVHAWTGDHGQVEFNAPTDVTLVIDDLLLRTSGGQIDVSGLRLDGYVDIHAPSINVGDVTVEESELRVEFETASAESSMIVTISGLSTVEADTVEVRGRVALGTDPLAVSETGTRDAAALVSQLRPGGRIRVENLPLLLARPILGEHADLTGIVGDHANLELQFESDDLGTALTTLARSSNLSMSATAGLKPGVVSLQGASIHSTLTPEAFGVLAAKYLAPDGSATAAPVDAASTPVLRAPARIKLTVNPFDYVLGRDDDQPLPVTAHIALLDDADVSGLPGVARTVRLAEFRSTATSDLSRRQPHRFRGTMEVRDAEADTSLASLQLTADLPTEVGQPRTVHAALTGVDVGLAESMLGRPSGSLTGLLGTGGDLSLKLVPDRSEEAVAFDLALERLQGTLVGRIADGTLSVVEPATLQLAVSPEAATTLIAQILDDPGNPPLRFSQEAVLNVSAEALEIDLERPADWTSWIVDARAGIPSVAGTTLSGQVFGYRDLQATLTSSRGQAVAKPSGPVDELHVTLRGSSRAQPESSASPAIDIDLTAELAVSSPAPEEPPQVVFAETRWSGVVMIDNLDTTLVDELSSMNGSLVNALGSNATLHAALRDLSTTSGRVEARFASPASSLVLSSDVIEGSFRVDPGPERVSPRVSRSWPMCWQACSRYSASRKHQARSRHRS